MADGTDTGGSKTRKKEDVLNLQWEAPEEVQLKIKNALLEDTEVTDWSTSAEAQELLAALKELREQIGDHLDDNEKNSKNIRRYVDMREVVKLSHKDNIKAIKLLIEREATQIGEIPATVTLGKSKDAWWCPTSTKQHVTEDWLTKACAKIRKKDGLTDDNILKERVGQELKVMRLGQALRMAILLDKHEIVKALAKAYLPEGPPAAGEPARYEKAFRKQLACPLLPGESTNKLFEGVVLYLGDHRLNIYRHKLSSRPWAECSSKKDDQHKRPDEARFAPEVALPAGQADELREAFAKQSGFGWMRRSRHSQLLNAKVHGTKVAKLGRMKTLVVLQHFDCSGFQGSSRLDLINAIENEVWRRSYKWVYLIDLGIEFVKLALVISISDQCRNKGEVTGWRLWLLMLFTGHMVLGAVSDRVHDFVHITSQRRRETKLLGIHGQGDFLERLILFFSRSLSFSNVISYVAIAIETWAVTILRKSEYASYERGVIGLWAGVCWMRLSAKITVFRWLGFYMLPIINTVLDTAPFILFFASMFAAATNMIYVLGSRNDPPHLIYSALMLTFRLAILMDVNRFEILDDMPYFVQNTTAEGETIMEQKERAPDDLAEFYWVLAWVVLSSIGLSMVLLQLLVGILGNNYKNNLTKANELFVYSRMRKISRLHSSFIMLLVRCFRFFMKKWRTSKTSEEQQKTQGAGCLARRGGPKGTKDDYIVFATYAGKHGQQQDVTKRVDDLQKEVEDIKKQHEDIKKKHEDTLTINQDLQDLVKKMKESQDQLLEKLTREDPTGPAASPRTGPL